MGKHWLYSAITVTFFGIAGTAALTTGNQAHADTTTDTAAQLTTTEQDKPKINELENETGKTTQDSQVNDQKTSQKESKDKLDTSSQINNENSNKNNKSTNGNNLVYSQFSEGESQHEQITVTYHDDDTDTDLTSTTGEGIVGTNTDSLSSDVKKVSDKLQKANFDFVGGDIPSKFDKEGSFNIVMHYKHHFNSYTETGNGVVTVHYWYDKVDGKRAHDDISKTVLFHRNVEYDVAWNPFGENLKRLPSRYSEWQPDGDITVKIDSPVIKGYTPTDVDPEDAGNVNNPNDATQVTDKAIPESLCEFDIVYIANTEQAHVTYVDDTTGKAIDGTGTDLSGKYGESINKSAVDDTINSLESDGYTYVSGKDSIPATYDWDGSEPVYVIHLNHGKTTVNDNDGKGTETVHYVYTDGTEAAKDQNKEITFHRTGTKDLVTGDISWGDYIPDGDVNVSFDSPDIEGYTPDQKQVNATIIEGKNGEVTVVYTANTEQAHIKYVDQDENNKVIDQNDINGKFGEKSNYSTKDEIAKLENEGYELVSDGYPAGFTFNSDNPTFIVVLKHKTKNVTPDTPGTPGQQPVPYPNDPDKDTPIHYIKNEVPVTPEKPSAPVTPAKVEKSVSANKPAETPKKNALPQTGQNNSHSLMSTIGLILLSIIGFFGLKRKRK